MVSRQLFSKGQSLAIVQEARSRALWNLGRKEKALLAQQDAAKLMPKSYKIVLCQARLYLALGKVEEAQNVIEGLIDKHKHALLPRLYLASLLWQNKKTDEAKSSLRNIWLCLIKNIFHHHLFGQPAAKKSLHELFYRDDLNFLFRTDRFLELLQAGTQIIIAFNKVGYSINKMFAAGSIEMHIIEKFTLRKFIASI